MTYLNPSDAVAQQENLTCQIFDELRNKTFDGIGVTRASYGDGEQVARDIMAKTATQMGLIVEDDAAGNVYMTLKGEKTGAKPVIIGSHIDSVAQGGNFDGAAGVVSGLIACASLIESGITPSCDIKVMGIRAEESAWFGVSYIGSRSALGTLPPDALQNANRVDTGRTLGDHMRSAGCNPDALKEGHVFLPPDSLRAYLEVHIEQGPVLEEAEVPVAIVTGIRGNRRLPKATCIGEYSHCGGVPRSHRRDSVIATAELVSYLDQVWEECEKEGKDFAFTVGKFFTDSEWHAMTKISGNVEFSLDMRSLDGGFVDSMVGRVKAEAEKIARRRGVTFDLGEFTRADPGVMDPLIKEAMLKGAELLQIPHMQLASGASHDAAAFAAAGVPTQMLFIRNANGSHNPDEAMRISDFMEATKLLTWWLSNKL
jgi:N-carbamoyl-L-amino-acid hydrolase